MSCNSSVHEYKVPHYDSGIMSTGGQWDYLSPCSWDSVAAASSASNDSADTVYSLELVPVSGKPFRSTDINAEVNTEYDINAGLEVDGAYRSAQKWDETVGALADKLMADYASFFKGADRTERESARVNAKAADVGAELMWSILDLSPSESVVERLSEYSDTLSKGVNEIDALFGLAEKFETEYVKKIYTKTENYVTPTLETVSKYPLSSEAGSEEAMQCDALYYTQSDLGALEQQSAPEASHEYLPSSNKETKVKDGGNNDKATATSPRQKRHRSNLPSYAREAMRRWLEANIDSPYPSEKDKLELVRKAKITMNQLNNWFINARRRPSPLLAQAQKNSKPHRPGRPGRPKQKRAKLHDADAL